MRKRVLVFLSFLMLLVIPTQVFAQTASTTTMATEETSTVTPTKVSAKNPISTRAQALTEAKDEMMEAREEFKTKMAEIKDAKKAATLTNLDARIQAINTKRTDEMAKRIERLTKILGTISEKAEALKSQGKDTTILESEIDTAKTSLEEASQAVSDQAGKDYVVNITTEAALRTTASTTVKEFTADIKAVHKKVVDAQLAIKDAYKELGLLMGTTKTTPTVTTTP